MPADATPLRACPSGSTAETGGGRSEMADTSRVVRATAHRFPAPRALRSTQHGSRATDARGYPRDEQDEAPAQSNATVLRSTPNVQSLPHAEMLRASPECSKSKALGIYETGSRLTSNGKQVPDARSSFELETHGQCCSWSSPPAVSSVASSKTMTSERRSAHRQGDESSGQENNISRQF